jgi:hypothetical protein
MMKIKGDKRMLVNHGTLESTKNVALQNLHDMVKAILPES